MIFNFYTDCQSFVKLFKESSIFYSKFQNILQIYNFQCKIPNFNEVIDIFFYSFLFIQVFINKLLMKFAMFRRFMLNPCINDFFISLHSK